MNAKEAKESTYRVRPPLQPPVLLYDAIAMAASKGLRSIAIPRDFILMEEMEWWLEDEGYSFTTVDDVAMYRKQVVVCIHW